MVTWWFFCQILAYSQMWVLPLWANVSVGNTEWYNIKNPLIFHCEPWKHLKQPTIPISRWHLCQTLITINDSTKGGLSATWILLPFYLVISDLIKREIVPRSVLVKTLWIGNQPGLIQGGPRSLSPFCHVPPCLKQTQKVAFSVSIAQTPKLIPCLLYLHLVKVDLVSGREALSRAPQNLLSMYIIVI